MRTVEEMKKAVVVRGDSRFKSGKVKHAVFHPTEARLVGFIIHKHDTLGMIKHEDHFLAFDSFTVSDGKLRANKDAAAWDEKACERLGIDYDKCIIWKAMPVVTESGVSLGKVDDVEYDERTGEVSKFITADGALSEFLLGDHEIGGREFLRFSDGKIVVANPAARQTTGGAAAKAGEAVGKMKAKAPEVGKSADAAVQKGAYKLGELIGTAKQALEPDDEDVKRAAAESDARQAELDAAYEEARAEKKEVAQGDGERGEERPASESMGYAVGKQIRKAQGMFAAFKEEYDKEVNGK